MEKAKTRENCVENLLSVAFSSVEFFLVMLDNAVRIRDKMQVVYNEMTLDEVNSNKAKLNLIGEIQFKGMKSATCSCSATM